MKKILGGLFIFALGFGSGAIVCYVKLKNKYEVEVSDQLEIMQEFYKKHYENKQTDICEEPKKEEVSPSSTKDIVKEAQKMLATRNYISYSNVDEMAEFEERGNDVDNYPEPYVISPDEYGEVDGYDVQELIYYSDKLLADNFDNLISDVESTVGWESLTKFGEYEEDVVHVRNEKLHTDYEIIYDEQRYQDVVEDSPYHKEDDD